MSSSTGASNYRTKADYYTPVDLAEVVILYWLRELAKAYPEVDPTQLEYLEGHVGGGAWARALYAHGLVFRGNLEVQDFDHQAEGLLLPGDHDSTRSLQVPGELVQTGFLVTPTIRVVDVSVGNPPYGVPKPCRFCAVDPVTPGPGCPKCKDKGVKGVVPLAELHVARACELAQHAVQLLRLAFLESKVRAQAARKYGLRHVWVLPTRPPFAQVCPGCAGTGVSRFSDPCEVCGGTGKRRKKSGSDSAAYGVFWFDRDYNGNEPEPAGYDAEKEGPWRDNPASWSFTTSVLPWGHR